MAHYEPRDFSAHLRWRQPNSGQYPRVQVPGFYLTAGFANEGEAEWIKEDVLLEGDAFDRLIKAMDEVAPTPRMLSAATSRLADEGRRTQRAELARLKEAQESNAARIAALEKVLEG